MEDFSSQLSNLAAQFQQDLVAVVTSDDVETLRIQYLGRKSPFQDVMRSLKNVSADQRKELGQAANKAKQDIETAIDAKETELAHLRFERLGTDERIDITLPGEKAPVGHLHMTTHAIRDIRRIFEHIGFTQVRHPEIDWEWYPFDVLRINADHPARDNWETFFLNTPADLKKGKMVLVPHVSNGQVREMERGELPIRSMNIAKSYRRQSDVSHVPMFHQFEGWIIDKGIRLTDLKGVMEYFVKEYFGEDREIRLRPHHFRFTEPSMELDISCGLCAGKGCSMCKEGWVELGGAGMMHPDVLRAGGVDPEVYSGLAFGWGVERTLSMKAGLNIADLRTMYKNDVRFLEQF